ncbi:ImmA/IrrE family metallo-endopeptidase [Amycolatopsis sp. lyj-23]|uniref:ImmA/IrrE family metallo-endopeptidase n=1 Tax=Amycolatopsis sp. lyj-23 TaxID=2789283 RepID=UPI00397E670F
MESLESAADINKRVDRLLRAADAYGRFPTPVEDIVAAAKLVQADGYVLDESMISQAPAYLRTLLRSAKQKIQGLVDRRERVIHISPDIDHAGKRRFVALHETTHDILPHQQDLLYADDTETLAAGTRRLFEREANQGAAELLFQRTRFENDAADMEISSGAIRALAERYGSSLHAAVRRYAETHPGQVAAIVLSRTPTTSNPPTWARQECMATPGWTAQFGPARWPRLMTATDYPFLTALTLPSLGHVQLPDMNGNAIMVQVDAFQTPYTSFVLLWSPQRRRLLPRRKIYVAA